MRGISFALEAIVSHLGFDTLIIIETELLLKENCSWRVLNLQGNIGFLLKGNCISFHFQSFGRINMIPDIISQTSLSKAFEFSAVFCTIDSCCGQITAYGLERSCSVHGTRFGSCTDFFQEKGEEHGTCSNSTESINGFPRVGVDADNVDFLETEEVT